MGGILILRSMPRFVPVPNLETETPIEYEELLFFKKQLSELEGTIPDVEFVPLSKTGTGGRAGVVSVHRSAHVHCHNRNRFLTSGKLARLSAFILARWEAGLAHCHTD